VVHAIRMELSITQKADRAADIARLGAIYKDILKEFGRTVIAQGDEDEGTPWRCRRFDSFDHGIDAASVIGRKLARDEAARNPLPQILQPGQCSLSLLHLDGISGKGYRQRRIQRSKYRLALYAAQDHVVTVFTQD